MFLFFKHSNGTWPIEIDDYEMLVKQRVTINNSDMKHVVILWTVNPAASYRWLKLYNGMFAIYQLVIRISLAHPVLVFHGDRERGNASKQNPGILREDSTISYQDVRVEPWKMAIYQ